MEPNKELPSPSETLRFMERQITFNEKLESNLDSIGKQLVIIQTETKGIHEQTKKTNGTVIEHEKQIAENKKQIDEFAIWKKNVMYVFVIINTILIGVATAYLIKLIV